MARLLCFLLGHQYRIIQEFSYATRRVGCERCRREWGMNDNVGAFLPWDGEFAEFYHKRGHHILKWYR